MMLDLPFTSISHLSPKINFNTGSFCVKHNAKWNHQRMDNQKDLFCLERFFQSRPIKDTLVAVGTYIDAFSVTAAVDG